MRHEREPSRRRDEPPTRDAEQLPEHALLALQRAAGNRAVGAMLARDVSPEVEPADAKKDAGPSGPHVIVPGIGAIALQSYQMSVNRREGPPTGSREEKPKDGDKDELPGGVNIANGTPPIEGWSVNCTAMKFEFVEAAP
jgi:hypothetical protein